MPKKQCAVAILAAGKGTRLNLSVPKALAPLLGQTLLDFALETLNQSSLNLDLGLVLGHKKEEIEDYLGDQKISIAHQAQQLGTGHALQCFFNDLPHMFDHEYVFVTCVDTPLITADIFEKMYEKLESNADLQGVAVSFHSKKPFGYGRIKRENLGFQIIEEKDASASEQAITEVNSGLYLLRTKYVKRHLSSLGNNNNSGEFYLTDLFKTDELLEAIAFKNEDIFLGINDLSQLSTARNTLRLRKIKEFELKGVLIEDQASFFFDWKVDIAPSVVIEPSVKLEGRTKLESGCKIGSFSVIKNSVIGSNTNILTHSHIEESIIDENCHVGPFARLRPGAKLGNKVKIGNFVEIKKSTFHAGAKASHLSYIGDAEIGENSNIGCGFITCNYDGANKHKTIIGKDVFIGSDCQMIAPLEVGDHSFIAAGSTINRNVPAQSFAIARTRQVTKEGMASKFIKKKD